MEDNNNKIGNSSNNIRNVNKKKNKNDKILKEESEELIFKNKTKVNNLATNYYNTSRQIKQNNHILFVQKDNIAITVNNHYKLILPTALIYQPIVNKSRTTKINGKMSQKIIFCSKFLFKNGVYISFALLYNKN